ncbi:MAG: response regulator transcription factor [Lachnospiraceae bacterium]|nr:response regulator transcription factor [Lachnospiraceae bacterium]
METNWIKEKTILIVDDEAELLTMLKSIFERAGYHNILTAVSGEEALTLMTAKMPDMVITDVMMPGMDGFELLQEIRAVSKIPVLMLTARGEAQDRFDGFELGADDYVIKPFLPKELLLRVEAIMKRAYPREKKLLILENAVVDLDNAQVIKKEETISLTAKEYSILVKLAENAGKIVTIGALCQNLCGDIWQGYETTLMSHIRHLREKIELEPSKPVSLITVKGLGYKLVVKE